MSNKKKIATLGLLCCLAVPAVAQAGGGSASSQSNANNVTDVTAGARSSAYGGTNISNQTSGAAASALTGSSSATAGNVTINNMYGSDPSGSSGNSSGNGNLPASGQNATGATTGTGTGTTATTDPTAANTFYDNVHYSGSQTIRNTPDAIAPALYGGTNPCSVGVSGGLGLPGFGISAGGTWSDRGCERRNGAVILFQANLPDVAVALLCQDSDMRTAFGSAGKPCPQDRAVAAKQTAAATPAPVQRAAAQPAAAAAPATTAQAGYRGPAPAWCSSPIKDATDRAYHTYYCR